MNDAFGDALRKLTNERRLKAVSAAVSEAGVVVWSTGWGTVARKGPAVTLHTPFAVASLTKPVAAVVMLQLVEQGLLDLERSVASFEFERNTPHIRMIKARPEITVRHLLTHTSGLPVLPLRVDKRAQPAGRAFSYNGATFGVLAHVAAAITDTPFADLVADRVLAPCGMARSAPGADAGGMFSATIRQTVKPARPPGPIARLLRGNAFNAGAGLISTPSDYLQFDALLAAGGLLGAATLDQAWTPAGDDIPYGLGFFVSTIDGRNYVWHPGYEPGYSSALYVRDITERRSLVVLANGDGLTRGENLAAGDLRNSAVARLFLA